MSKIQSAMQDASTGECKPPRSLGVRAIALYKLAKTIGLILVAIAAFRLDRTQTFERLVHWLEQLSLGDSNGLRWKLVDVLQSMGPSKFVAIIVYLVRIALQPRESH